MIKLITQGDDYGRVPSNTFENKNYNEMKRNLSAARQEKTTQKTGKQCGLTYTQSI
jgi:hypothetical protein